MVSSTPSSHVPILFYNHSFDLVQCSFNLVKGCLKFLHIETFALIVLTQTSNLLILRYVLCAQCFGYQMGRSLQTCLLFLPLSDLKDVPRLLNFSKVCIEEPVPSERPNHNNVEAKYTSKERMNDTRKGYYMIENHTGKWHVLLSQQRQAWKLRGDRPKRGHVRLSGSTSYHKAVPTTRDQALADE